MNCLICDGAPGWCSEPVIGFHTPRLDAGELAVLRGMESIEGRCGFVLSSDVRVHNEMQSLAWRGVVRQIGWATWMEGSPSVWVLTQAGRDALRRNAT